jgi:hypothetical protein
MSPSSEEVKVFLKSKIDAEKDSARKRALIEAIAKVMDMKPPLVSRLLSSPERHSIPDKYHLPIAQLFFGENATVETMARIIRRNAAIASKHGGRE